MRYLVAILLLLTPGLADSWSLPETRNYSSQNGEFSFKVVPARIESRLKYFQDLEGGKTKPGRSRTSDRPCTGILSLAGKGEVWTEVLQNPVAPVSALVTNDGRHVVTLNDWHQVGYGPNVVVIYDSEGNKLHNFYLQSLLSDYEQRNLMISTSSRWWLETVWVSNSHLYLATKADKIVSIEFGSGKVEAVLPVVALKDLKHSPTLAALQVSYDNQLKAPEVFRSVVTSTNSSMPVRLLAAACLGPDQASEKLFHQAIQGQNKEEKELALSMIGSVFADDKALSLLCDQLEESVSHGALVQGFSTLSEDLLLELLSDPSADCQRYAIAALENLGSADAVPEMLKIAAGESEYARSALEKAIKLKGKDLNSVLAKFEASRPDVRRLLALHFSKHKYVASMELLISGLEDSAITYKDYFREALVFQSGSDLGREGAPWRRWVQGDSLVRRKLELEAGDAGVLERLLPMMDGPYRREVLGLLEEALGKFPRVVQSFDLRGSGRTELLGHGDLLLTQTGLWDLENSVQLPIVVPDNLLSFHINAGGDRLLTTADFKEVELWSTTGELLGIAEHAGWVKEPCFSPGGNRFLSADEHGVVSIRDSENGDEIGALELDEFVCDAAFVPEKPQIVVTLRDKAVLYDFEERKVLSTIKTPRALDVENVESEGALLGGGHQVHHWDFGRSLELRGENVQCALMREREVYIGTNSAEVLGPGDKAVKLPSQPASISCKNGWTAVRGEDSKVYLWQDSNEIIVLRPPNQGFFSGYREAKLLSENRLLLLTSRQALVYQLPPFESTDSLTDEELVELAQKKVLQDEIGSPITSSISRFSRTFRLMIPSHRNLEILYHKLRGLVPAAGPAGISSLTLKAERSAVALREGL